MSSAGAGATIIPFPLRIAAAPPQTEMQQAFDRVVDLLRRRAQAKGIDCSRDRAAAALTRAMREVRPDEAVLQRHASGALDRVTNGVVARTGYQP